MQWICRDISSSLRNHFSAYFQSMVHKESSPLENTFLSRHQSVLQRSQMRSSASKFWCLPLLILSLWSLQRNLAIVYERENC